MQHNEMAKTSVNNKRIAKNTLYLYIRMLLVMAISLYTVRAILDILGVVDYGIYNVVGGVVTMFAFMNRTLSTSSQRYFSVALAKNDHEDLKRVFSLNLTVFSLLGIIVVFLLETVGLWFVNNKMTIPAERMGAANVVYQLSILAMVFHIFVIPYMALVIAYEKMNIFAYISLADTILKLAIVYVLLVVPFDKLVIYGLMLMFLHILNASVYFIYCNKKYQESRYSFYWDTPLFKELLSYTGWNLFGSFSTLAKGQGLNILLNMFFNPSVNAARGIAYQVNTTVSHFFTNFYTAVRPQITKYYAQNDLNNMFKLVFRSSRMAFFLILLISLPLVIEAPYVIRLWLGQLPEFVVPFMRLILVITAVDAMANPLMTTAHATGKIALYQSLVGTMTILNVPISYVFLSLGYGPVIVFEISLVIAGANLFLRLWIVKRLVDFPVLEYIRKVFLNCLIVTVLAALIPVVVNEFVTDDFIGVLIVCSLAVLSTLVATYIAGLDRNERTFVLEFAKKILKRK